MSFWNDPWYIAPNWARALRDQLTRMETQMATKEQLDKLRNDVAALIDAGVDEIKAAIAAAQTNSADPAIDELDNRVTASTQSLKEAAAALRNPPTP